MAWLADFVNASVLSYPLNCVLQVGSTSRGYALDNSDVDLMAFYDAGGALRAYPNHTMVGDARVTIEHHDLSVFLRENGDFRFNPGSLRQMHKVRDGIAVIGDVEKIRALRDLADTAALDPRLPLRLLAEIQSKTAAVKITSPYFQHQSLINWSELLATFVATTHVGGPAYSKPKWLLRMLDTGGLADSAALIRSLYAPADLRRAESFQAVLAMYEDVRGQIPDSHEILLRTAMNDARQMLVHKHADAGPAVRFATVQLWRALNDRLPMDDLRLGAELPTPILGALGTVSVEKLEHWWIAFTQVTEQAWRLVVPESQDLIASTIGTTRFVTHLLDTYEATEMLPYLSSIRVSEWISKHPTFQGG